MVQTDRNSSSPANIGTGGAMMVTAGQALSRGDGHLYMGEGASLVERGLSISDRVSYPTDSQIRSFKQLL